MAYGYLRIIAILMRFFFCFDSVSWPLLTEIKGQKFGIDFMYSILTKRDNQPNFSCTTFEAMPFHCNFGSEMRY